MRRVRVFGCFFSAALCVLLVFMWGRSTESADDVAYTVAKRDGNTDVFSKHALLSRAGSVGVWFVRERGPATGVPPPWREWHWAIASRDNSVFPRLNRFGFAFGKVVDSTPERQVVSYVAMVPYWVLMVLSGIAPVRGFWVMRRAGVRACAGMCVGCGYDLRGSADRCPECGLVRGDRAVVGSGSSDPA